MEQTIEQGLISKGQQLSATLSVRARNIMTRLLKDVEGTLMPIIDGTADIRNVPQCGAQTAEELSEAITLLRKYYEQLEMSLPGYGDGMAIGGEMQNFAGFRDLEEETERLLEDTFRQTLEKHTDVRARNLINAHIHSYRETEPYIIAPETVAQWHGAGLQSIGIIKRFLSLFFKEYLRIVNTDLVVVRQRLAQNDYPFLTASEASFVASFLTKEGYYPMFYIALRYFRQTDYKQARVFARVLGIKGKRKMLAELAEEFQLTRERIRQLCLSGVIDAREKSQMWNRERWAAHPCFPLKMLNTSTTEWEQRRENEQLDGLDFLAFLQILSLVRPMSIVGLVLDSAKNLTHTLETRPGHEPYYVVGYEPHLECYDFSGALGELAHAASLQRIEDKRIPLKPFLEGYLRKPCDEPTRQAVDAVLYDVFQHINTLCIEGDDIVLKANRTNYMEEIRQILLGRGAAMTVEEIYQEFRQRHPEDHHDKSAFIRNYMLRDDRFEAVGSKSTYQLKEWGFFSGMLGELAEDILKDYDEPIPTERLCELMLERRPTSTLKSCNTSVYLAVKSGLLDYYYLGLVGRAGEPYDKRFWVSPVTTSGTVRSLRRYLSENGRWPFHSADGIEGALGYAKRKYDTHLHVTDQEVAEYLKGMEDINFDQYPANNRDLVFVGKCQAIIDFCNKNNRMPTRREAPVLMGWYEANVGRCERLTGCRLYYFRKVLEKIVALSK